MKDMPTRPGVMIYFDMLPLMKLLSEIQRGQLVMGILEYGANGTEPDYSDDTELAIAWTQIKPKTDRDEERYYESVLQRRYAAYCKGEKAHGREPCGYNEWKESYYLLLTKETTDNGCYPTITTATSTSTIPTTSSYISTPTSGKGECERENLLSDEEPYGAYKPLSEDEFEKRRQRGLEMLSRGAGTPLQ